MLDDRPYIRRPAFDSRRSATMILLVALVALFVLEWGVIFYGRLPVEDWLGLSLHGLVEKRFWQPLTFQFLHAGPWPFHLLFNCIGLYFFGRSVEEAIGTRSFLKLYFLSGFVGGAVQILATWVLPQQADGPVVGASAGVMGLIAAYARLFPLREITMFVYFFPITLRAQYFFWFSLLISAFGTLVPFGGIAHGAHLGGLLMGVVFLRWSESNTTLFRSPFSARRRKRQLVQAAAQITRWRSVREQAAAELPPEEFISREVDPILDKMLAHGPQSLTPRERQILEAASAKMAKR